MKTDVVIIGGGPSGLLLSQLLLKIGVETIVLERKTKDYVLSRIRAGVLEQGMVQLMEEAGCAERLRAESYQHDGTLLAYDQTLFRIAFTDHTEHPVTVYGQTEVTRDLYEAREAAGGKIVFNVEDVEIHDAKSDAPYVTYNTANGPRRIDCAFIAGCDGFHGVSRKTIPDDVRTEYERVYPFGWLGILSETPPVSHELIYANSPRGFALCSMRNASLSRYYVQCPLDDDLKDWPDDRFWSELKARIPQEAAEKLVTGPTIEKSIAPLRSFVCEPMQWGRLFLVGDAAHIVPPTGAKGLNTAASDVYYLYSALKAHFQDNDPSMIAGYSAAALDRVWKTVRFSWWFTNLMHRFPDQTDFDRKMQVAELSFLRTNKAAQAAMSQSYVGLPY